MGLGQTVEILVRWSYDIVLDGRLRTVLMFGDVLARIDNASLEHFLEGGFEFGIEWAGLVKSLLGVRPELPEPWR